MKRVRALCQGCTACQRERLEQALLLPAQGNDIALQLCSCWAAGNVPDEFADQEPSSRQSQEPSHLACHAALVKHTVRSSVSHSVGSG